MANVIPLRGLRGTLWASLLTILGCASTLPIEGVVRPRPGEAFLERLPDPSIRFPSFHERFATRVGGEGQTYELDGATLRALSIATQDFLPSGGAQASCADKPEAHRYRVIDPVQVPPSSTAPVPTSQVASTSASPAVGLPASWFDGGTPDAGSSGADGGVQTPDAG
jgi:hypothetical protein